MSDISSSSETLARSCEADSTGDLATLGLGVWDKPSGEVSDTDGVTSSLSMLNDDDDTTEDIAAASFEIGREDVM